MIHANRRAELRQVFRGAFGQQRAIKGSDPGRVRPTAWGLMAEKPIRAHVETMKSGGGPEPGADA